ncbi:MAG: hypothetical protein ABIN61_03655, partial [candidate division WOR-3 bacterium]
RESLVSDRAYPLDTLPATLKYLVNQKARVRVDVYRGGKFLVKIEDRGSVVGGRWQFASWNGIINNIPVESGSDYKFRITAYSLPDFTDSISVFSDNFMVMDSLPLSLGKFFIPPDYYVGKIHSDSVFNGKTDFLWEASASGEVYPPQRYVFVDTAKGIRKRVINWQVEVNAWAGWGVDGKGLRDSVYIFVGLSGASGVRDTAFFYVDPPCELMPVKVEFVWCFNTLKNFIDGRTYRKTFGYYG